MFVCVPPPTHSHIFPMIVTSFHRKKGYGGEQEEEIPFLKSQPELALNSLNFFG